MVKKDNSVVMPLGLSKIVVLSTRYFRLFVYGTLMRGGVRHAVLADQRFLGEVRTQPAYALVDLGAYPGLIHRAQNGRSIRGELYEVATRLIERLDQMEGAPSLYRLEPVLLEGTEDGAFTYIYQQDTTGVPLCQEDCWKNEG